MRKLMVILLGLSAVGVYAQNQNTFVQEARVAKQEIQSQPQEVKDAYASFMKKDGELIGTLARGAKPAIVNGRIANTNVAITGATETYIANFIKKYHNDPAKLTKIFNQGSQLLDQLIGHANAGNQKGVESFLNAFDTKIQSEPLDDSGLTRLTKYAESQSGIKITEKFTPLTKSGPLPTTRSSDEGVFVGRNTSKAAGDAGIEDLSGGSSKL